VDGILFFFSFQTIKMGRFPSSFFPLPLPSCERKEGKLEELSCDAGPLFLIAFCCRGDPRGFSFFFLQGSRSKPFDEPRPPKEEKISTQETRDTRPDKKETKNPPNKKTLPPKQKCSSPEPHLNGKTTRKTRVPTKKCPHPPPLLDGPGKTKRGLPVLSPLRFGHRTHRPFLFLFFLFFLTL